MTVRPTSFDKAERTGAGAAIEIVEGGYLYFCHF
jgi:hypothetical protein